MPTFAEMRDKATKAKDATVKKAVDTKDRHSSVPLKNTNWDPYSKNPPPPPPPRANKFTKPTPQPSFAPPPQRSGPSAGSPAPSPSPRPGPPPIVRPSAAASGPPPIVRATRPSLPSTSSSTPPPPPVRAPVLSRFRQPEPEEDEGPGSGATTGQAIRSTDHAGERNRLGQSVCRG
ncbi:hypothetical protein B0H14DRAFT_3859517 [Mycena olivaceomarginata]|nr:hypothetical protein B0H14DRAFT_3859517 [Mycena olivaceomarginata]